MLLLTRRALLPMIPALPFLARNLSAAKEFWELKDADQWTPEETQALLTNSPWAKQASISVNNGPGIMGGGIPGGGLTNNRSRTPSGSASTTASTGKGGTRVTRTGTGQTPDASGKSSDFNAVVRWQSARPIRLASKDKSTDSKSYILAVTGSFPDFVRPSDDEPADVREQRRQMMRELTRLERKGDSPIYLDRVEAFPGGNLFYFSRLEAIKPSTKEITFVTKMGPLELKAKFPLKDMMYRGQLEL
jgi:hypothetical protein